MPPRAKSTIADGGAPSFTDHPLFPVEEGDNPPNVAFIHVTRYDLGVQKFGPLVRADDLVSLDAIAQMWGGGKYELIARGPSVRDPSQPGNITRRRRYDI